MALRYQNLFPREWPPRAWGLDRGACSCAGAAIIALTLLACGPSRVERETEYIATRDAYKKAIAARQRLHVPATPADLSADIAALHDLEARVRPIVGDFRAAGFPGLGKINIATLYPGNVDSGLLDGLLFRSADSTARIVVTTRALFMNWLGFGVTKPTWTPHDLDASLRRPELYTAALETDAAVVRYADIPVDSAARTGVVAAMLVRREQDDCDCTPDEVVIGVVRGERIFIVDMPARDTIAPMRECVAVWNDGQRRSGEIMKASRRGNSVDTSSWGRAFRAGVDAASLYRACYAEQVRHEPRLARLAAQVRDIVALLPAK